MERRLTRREFCKATAAAAGVALVATEVVAAADGPPKEVVHDFTVRPSWVMPCQWMVVPFVRHDAAGAGAARVPRALARDADIEA